MGLFDFLTSDIAIDLGTANTLIIHKDTVVVDEPSIIAMDKTTGKVLAIGSASPELEVPLDDYQIRGRDLMTGIPKEIRVTYSEIAYSLDKSISKIEEGVMKALEISPPELSADIFKNGIYLTGGGALIHGLDRRIAQKTKLPVHIADDPLKAVVKGTGEVLKNLELYKPVLIS